MMIEIEGQQVEVDDSFAKLTPEQKNSTVDEIAASLKMQPKQTQQPYTGTILPLHKDENGNISFAMPTMLSGLIDSGTAAVTAPYRAMTGELPMTDRAGNTSPEAISEAANMALWATPTSIAHGTGKEIARNAGVNVANDALERISARFMGKTVPSSTEKAALISASERIGVQLPRSVTADTKIVQSTGKALENQPLIGSPIIKANEAAKTQLDAAVKKVQDEFGTGSIYNAGTEVKAAAQQYAKKFLSDREKARYDAVDVLVTPNVITPLSKTGETMMDIIARRKNAALPDGPAVRLVKNAVFKQHGDTPKDLGLPVKPGESVHSVFNLSTGLNYQGIKDLRSYVRETLDNPESLQKSGFSESDLKRIYASLSDDLRTSVMRSGGKRATAAFEQANAYSLRASKERDALQKIIGYKEPEAIVDSISAAAGTNSRASLNKLFQARKAVSKETWDELTSAVISRMGRDAEGNFSPERWVTARSKLSETGKAMLFNTTGKKELAKSLADIDAVSKRIVELNKKYGNPSGTARNAGYMAVGAGLISNPITTVGGIIGGNTLSRYLASPETAKLVADYAKAYEFAARTPGNGAKTYLENMAKRLAMIVANDAGRPDMTASIFSKLVFPQKASADKQDGIKVGQEKSQENGWTEDQQFNDAYLQGNAL